MSTAKAIGHMLGGMYALPHRVAYAMAKPVFGPDRAFVAASERMAKAPGHVGVYARQAFYRAALDRVGVDIYFGFMSVFSKRQATLGDNVYIGRFCSIGWAAIGNHVMLADAVQILSGARQHGVETKAAPLQDNAQSFSQVSIGAGAWLGSGCIVMADVGANAIVGAGAVVTRPVPAGVKVAGVPARVIGHVAAAGGPEVVSAGSGAPTSAPTGESKNASTSSPNVQSHESDAESAAGAKVAR